MDLFFIIVWLGFGVVAALAAQARGRSFGGWLVLGCLFGVFALLAVLVMKDVQATQPANNVGSSFPTATEATAERKRLQAEKDRADKNFIQYYKDRRIERDGGQIKVLSKRFPNVKAAREAIDNKEI